MQSIQSIIEESPHKHNHIYHVLDAADFPMSLIPNLQAALQLPHLRTQNRRSKTVLYARSRRVAEVSFLITRSDLLAPKKEQVDTLMPYLQSVLRDALGRSGRDVRLGNVRCVSAKRGWWTKQVKEEIWGRGGAGWMVGKVNVGKSALVEAVFPKGRGEQGDVNPDRSRQRAGAKAEEEALVLNTMGADSAGELAESAAEAETESTLSQSAQQDAGSITPSDLDGATAYEQYDQTPDFDINNNDSLLPPALPETPYPHMPLVSALPGTTSAPIRLPFGSGKGELIDLPGVDRSALSTHILPSNHKEMILKSRITPEQFVLRAGQSLLLGGVIRLTPSLETLGREVVMLAYPFLPPAFAPHVTGTHKAIAIQIGVHSSLSLDRQGQVYEGNVPSIATPEAKETVKSAGTFELKWDVTKRRSGPLTDRVAGKRKTVDLPFVVYSADVLLESVGWIELVCQVRKRQPTFPTDEDERDALSILQRSGKEDKAKTDEEEFVFPTVEVFSPDGKFVGVRRPMGAAMLNEKPDPMHARRVRPRRSIGMRKRNAA
ncbi:hypothetical protein LTR62_007901 [Meristemomyces frigidus]|uniref:Uncharacterized protein n=1 Tax=Meristemomyces frigidus TaxID=1508187 RepID=A0AAN7YR73_9PEZI|nr:hypothetical protein LTR62_007901 [Meristemomyces frigidus]